MAKLDLQYMQALAAVIGRLRDVADLTQERVAKEDRLSVGTIKNLIARRGDPKLSTLVALAQGLRTPFASLLREFAAEIEGRVEMPYVATMENLEDGTIRLTVLGGGLRLELRARRPTE